MQTVIDLLNY